MYGIGLTDAVQHRTSGLYQGILLLLLATEYAEYTDNTDEDQAVRDARAIYNVRITYTAQNI